jgi:hypothetical protein
MILMMKHRQVGIWLIPITKANDQHWMGKTCSTHGINVSKTLVGNLKIRDYFGDFGFSGRIIPKLIKKK